MHPLIVTYALKNRLGYTRLGITTSKKIGKAVQRNRARRLIKTAYRNLLPEIAPGYDLVVVARTKATSGSYTDLCRGERPIPAQACAGSALWPCGRPPWRERR